MVPGLALMFTEGVREETTVILILLEVAEAGDGQGALDVITTVTTSPLLSEEVVNVLFVAPPTLLPLICH